MKPRGNGKEKGTAGRAAHEDLLRNFLSLSSLSGSSWKQSQVWWSDVLAELEIKIIFLCASLVWFTEPHFLQLEECCHYLDDWASAGMSGQWIIAAQGWLFSLPPCHGREKSPLLHFSALELHREERWKRAAGKQTELQSSRKWEMQSGSGHSMLHRWASLLFIAPATHRFYHITSQIDSPDAQTMWSNYAEHYVLKWAIYIGKCRLKILWFHHSSKHKAVIYCVYGIPFYEKAFL